MFTREVSSNSNIVTTNNKLEGLLGGGNEKLRVKWQFLFKGYSHSGEIMSLLPQHMHIVVNFPSNSNTVVSAMPLPYLTHAFQVEGPHCNVVVTQTVIDLV